MTHLKRNSTCKACREPFVRERETQVYCFGCLEKASAKAKRDYINIKKELEDDATSFFIMERGNGKSYNAN